jgi:hypothetical protein
MQEYAAYYGTACIIFSIYLLIKGFTAASRQRSEDHSTTLVPAYIYGILASILLTVGLGFFRPNLPWWGYRLIFPGTTMLFPAIIYPSVGDPRSQISIGSTHSRGLPCRQPKITSYLAIVMLGTPARGTSVTVI